MQDIQSCKMCDFQNPTSEGWEVGERWGGNHSCCPWYFQFPIKDIQRSDSFLLLCDSLCGRLKVKGQLGSTTTFLWEGLSYWKQDHSKTTMFMLWSWSTVQTCLDPVYFLLAWLETLPARCPVITDLKETVQIDYRHPKKTKRFQERKHTGGHMVLISMSNKRGASYVLPYCTDLAEGK